MKMRNLMFLALLGPIAQPMVAKPAVTFGPDAVGQPAGFVGHFVTPQEPKEPAKSEKKRGKAEDKGRKDQRKGGKAEHKGGRSKAEQPKAQ